MALWVTGSPFLQLSWVCWLICLHNRGPLQGHSSFIEVKFAWAFCLSCGTVTLYLLIGEVLPRT